MRFLAKETPKVAIGGPKPMRDSLLDYLYENAASESDIALIYRPRLRQKVWTFADLARGSFQFRASLRPEISNTETALSFGQKTRLSG